MVKPEMVPSEVAGLVGYKLDCKPSEARDLIAAALNAWTGMREQKQGPFGITYDIILPIAHTQEDGDEA